MSNIWNELYNQLKIESSRGQILPKPTPIVLQEFESSSNFNLPLSYKDFIQVFGPGEIGKYFRIYAPGYGNLFADLKRFIQEIRSLEETLIETYRKSKFIKRMVPFADTLGGDIIVWDPSVVMDSEACEYGIYMLPDDKYKIIKLADSFTDFIQDICLSDAFGKIIGDPKYKVFQTFIPFNNKT